MRAARCYQFRRQVSAIVGLVIFASVALADERFSEQAALRAPRNSVQVSGTIPAALDQAASEDQTESVQTTSDQTASQPGATDRSRLPEHLVVLRVSAAVLSARMNRDVDRQIPVSDVILGTPVTGVARLVGHLRVQPVPSSEKACFNAVFAGTCYSRTVGRHAPVTVYGHTITRFTASQEVTFEPGKGFSGQPVKVAATTQSITDSIVPNRGGILGRIIQRRAEEQVAADRPTIAAIARERACQRISARMEEYMDEQLARLNKAVEFQTQLAALRSGDGRRRLFARTTPQFVEIADAIYSHDKPIAPLILPALANSDFPIEIWIHSSLIPERVGTALKKIFSEPDQSAIINGMAILPGTLGKETAAILTSLVSENKVKVQEAGEWTVVEINARAVNHLASEAAATATGAPARRR